MQVGVVTTKALGLTDTGQEPIWLRTVLDRCTRLQQATGFRVYCAGEEADLFHPWQPRVIDPEAPSGLRRWLGAARPGWERQLLDDQMQVALLPLVYPGAVSLPTVRYALQLADWEALPQGGRGRAALRRPPAKTVQETHRVIVTSQYLQQRCLEFFEVPLEKIRVAVAGTDAQLETAAGTFIEGAYLVGYCDEGSCAALLELIPLIWERFKNELDTIVIAGPGAPEEPKQWGGQVLRVESIPMVQRAGLYRGARCFFYPNRYDGACMPTLEALRAGVPVLAPVSGATRELLGDAPLFYNPDSKDSLFQNLRRVFQEPPEERTRRVDLGRQLARAKSWDRCAWEVLGAFKVSNP